MLKVTLRNDQEFARQRRKIKCSQVEKEVTEKPGVLKRLTKPYGIRV